MINIADGLWPGVKGKPVAVGIHPRLSNYSVLNQLYIELLWSL